MELDEFKQRLKEKLPEAGSLRLTHDLAGYIRVRSASSIKKIKRNILAELVACGVFIVASACIYGAYSALYVRAFSFLTVLLCCLLLWYLAGLYRQILSFDKTVPAIRDHLKQLIKIIEQFTRLYFQFTLIMLPVIFIFGLITGLLTVNKTAILTSFNWQRSLLFYCGLFIVWSSIMYFFSRWYIKKLYGNYLWQLKEQLRDIENG